MYLHLFPLLILSLSLTLLVMHAQVFLSFTDLFSLLQYHLPILASIIDTLSGSTSFSVDVPYTTVTMKRPTPHDTQ